MNSETGWCAKSVQLKESDALLSTERFCLQRPPSDNEERCSETMLGEHGRSQVFMCFCRGDFCNGSTGLSSTWAALNLLLPISLVYLMHSYLLGLVRVGWSEIVWLDDPAIWILLFNWCKIDVNSSIVRWITTMDTSKLIHLSYASTRDASTATEEWRIHFEFTLNSKFSDSQRHFSLDSFAREWRASRIHI